MLQLLLQLRHMDSTGIDGSSIDMTAEILISALTRARFARKADPTFGDQELKVIRR